MIALSGSSPLPMVAIYERRMDLSTKDGSTVQDGSGNQAEPPSHEDPGQERLVRNKSMLLSGYYRGIFIFS
jgi:hypothetical protein